MWIDAFPSGSVCRQLEVRVNYGSSQRQYKFKTEVDSVPVPFDISSSARAELRNDYLRAPGTARTSSRSANVYAVASWLLSGVHYEAPVNLKMEDGSTYSRNVNIEVRAGGLPASLRWEGYTSNTYNSLKPIADEVCNMGDTYYHNGSSVVLNTSNFPTLATSPNITIDGRSIYVENDPDRRMMVFLNSFCEFETFSLKELESLSYGISTEKRSLVSSPSFVPGPNAIAIHSDPVASFKMSSGWLTREWLEWVLTEFCKSSRHWLMQGGRLLPVLVTPEQSTLIYDKSDPSLVSIDFTVESALSGPIL